MPSIVFATSIVLPLFPSAEPKGLCVLQLLDLFFYVLQLLDQSVGLAQLHLFLAYDDDFVRFARKVLDDNTVTLNMIETLRRELAAFDLTIDQVQCYVSLYCHSAKIIVKDLEAKLAQLHKEYDTMSLSSTRQTFIGTPCLDDMPFLFQMSVCLSQNTSASFKSLF